MLKSLKLENFTVFANAELEFSPGINVIIGENGTGKTHLLKAGYCLNRAWRDLMRGHTHLSVKRAEVYFEKRLLGLYQADQLANLIRWNSENACLSAEIDALIPTVFIATQEEEMARQKKPFPFGCLVEPLLWKLSIQKQSELVAAIPETAATNSEVERSIFLPSKEIVSFYEGLGGLLREYKLKLDATYEDLANSLDFPELNSPPELPVIDELEGILGGRLQLEGKKLVFISKDGHRMETPLLAEGFRKLAMLPYFVRHGILRQKGETLFWDEPETNINPRLVTKLAESLITLAQQGVQIILATHSLFLLKEIDLQLQLAAESSNPVPARFFGLALGGNGVEISVGDVLEDIDPITALDMEIDQADRYNDWYDRVSHA